MEDVIDLAYAERKARSDNLTGLKALQSIHARIAKELEGRPPLLIQDLAINGGGVMKTLGIKPGPVVGELLRILHQQVLEDPALNEPKILEDLLINEYNIMFKFEKKSGVPSSPKEDENAG